MGIEIDRERFDDADYPRLTLVSDRFNLEVNPSPLADRPAADRPGPGVEGANTSFQVHLRVDPAEFARHLQRRPAGHRPGAGRRRQLADLPRPPAVGGDPGRAVQAGGRRPRRRRPASRRVSRVAFGTGWVRDRRLELFEESVRAARAAAAGARRRGPAGPARTPAACPRLDELRLHQGTVWRWNRAIYDPAGGGHLRIEMRRAARRADRGRHAGQRRLPARADPGPGPGRRRLDPRAAVRQRPTPISIAPPSSASTPSWSGRRPAARAGRGGRAGPAAAARARRGLVEAGVDAGEADGLLEVIGDRAASGQTGAVWQRRALAALEGRGGPRAGRRRAAGALPGAPGRPATRSTPGPWKAEGPARGRPLAVVPVATGWTR